MMAAWEGCAETLTSFSHSAAIQPGTAKFNEQ